MAAQVVMIDEAPLREVTAKLADPFGRVIYRVTDGMGNTMGICDNERDLRKFKESFTWIAVYAHVPNELDYGEEIERRN